jgi:hypothetical protein
MVAFAYTLGIIATVANAIQWLPQIWKTFKAKVRKEKGHTVCVIPLLFCRIMET